MEALCEYLEWDSNFFGLRIARYREHALTEDQLKSVEHWCRERNIDCLYLLAESSGARTTYLAEAHDFRLVDARVLLELEAYGSQKAADGVRPATADDLGALMEIARRSHFDSRFFFDLRFPRSRVEDLFAAWIERSLNGWASHVLVAHAKGRVAGYVTCHASESKNGSIGLLAVAEEYRGCGIGANLMSTALQVFEQKGVETVSVVTQARNIASQRLYQKAGFRTRSVQLWFHRWFNHNG